MNKKQLGFTLCNCDGSWHISIPDGDSWVTKYVDISELLNAVLAAGPKEHPSQKITPDEFTKGMLSGWRNADGDWRKAIQSLQEKERL